MQCQDDEDYALKLREALDETSATFAAQDWPVSNGQCVVSGTAERLEIAKAAREAVRRSLSSSALPVMWQHDLGAHRGHRFSQEAFEESIAQRQCP